MPDWFETLADSFWLLPDEQGEEEARFIHKALHLRKGQKVLDAPSGAGRVAVHVAGTGCVVTCADLRQSFITRARKRFRAAGVAGKFVVVDLRKIGFEAEFDAVYNWGGSFGYFTEDENFELVKRLARALRRGGRLLIGQPHREFILRHFLSEIRVGAAINRNQWNAKTNRIITRRAVGGRENPKDVSSMRLYTRSELQGLFERVGLTVEAVYGSIRGEGYLRTSRQLYMVGRKG